MPTLATTSAVTILPDFPITPLLPQIVAALETATRLVVEAPPGAGKTTRVPPALLAASWCTGRVLMLEPRRIAARAAAGFMAAERGEDVGETVGYRIRFESRVSAATRIEVVTEGILTRMLQDDPGLDGVSAVVFDEFHERNLASDLGLALCLDVQASLRPELRLLVMSATLDGERVARFLDAQRLTAPGRSFPIAIEHLAARRAERLEVQLRRAVERALAASGGDVLCFLPGRAEIERAARLLDGAFPAVEIAQLHGDLPVAAQARVLAAGPMRRVVLATNVAESSVTLPGVRAVIDSGLAREPRFDPVSGLSRLETVTISQASATQRAGRAGRVAPGICYRLWPEGQTLESSTRPEITQVELSGLALELAAWGAASLRFLDPPPPGALAQAEALLIGLHALDAECRLTARGRAMLALGLAPRLARALTGVPAALRALACDVAAVLEARDPLRGPARRDDDLRRRLQALAAYRSRRPDVDVDRRTLEGIDQTAQRWRRRLGVAPGAPADVADTGTVLAYAYPDRIAARDPTNALRYRLANGRGARVDTASALAGEAWLVAPDVRFDVRDSLILRAAPLDERVLEQHFAADFTAVRQVRFVRESRAVELVEERRFGAIVLGTRRLPVPRDLDTAAALGVGIAELGVACLPWTGALRAWQARVAFLRVACPELGLPDLSDAVLGANLVHWLAPALRGKARVDELTAGELAAALQQQLDHAARRAIDELAPDSVVVPSGARRPLDYTQGDAPVLAVKLQELFGLADGPRVARGRIAVVLHLLSPRQAPIQVTRDLRSFWERTYPEVKKELKGRYPRHPWPDDPWTATPTAKAKRRGG